MTSDELLAHLTQACARGTSALRAITDLEPVGGADDKVFPPTYAGGKYAVESRRSGNVVNEVVLLDSVQSQANRFEDALLRAWRAKQCSIPVMTVEVPGHGEVTSLNAPHRVSDAIFRDSELDGVMFRESPVGKSVVAARVANATAFYKVCPTALIFGTWDSQGGGGLQSAKIPRALTSEIIGKNVVKGVRTSSRIDPLDIQKGSAIIYKHDTDFWTLDEKDASKDEKGKAIKFGKGSKAGKPASINHGNVTPGIDVDEETKLTPARGGVTLSEAIQTTVLSFVQLRRLKFPNDAGDTNENRNVAGRTVLAALALYAIVLQLEEGYDLRSRCFLLPKSQPKFKLVGATAEDANVSAEFAVPVDVAKETLDRAIEAAEKYDLKFMDSAELRLTPSAKLIELVKRSDKIVEPDEESAK